MAEHLTILDLKERRKERRKDWLKSQLREVRQTKSMIGMRCSKMAPFISRQGLQTASNKEVHSAVVKMKRTTGTYRLMMSMFNL